MKSKLNKIKKIVKGDKIMWEGKKYLVEDVKENFKDGKPLYTVCRMESPDGVKLKLTCHKIIPDYEGELKKVK